MYIVNWIYILLYALKRNVISHLTTVKPLNQILTYSLIITSEELNSSILKDHYLSEFPRKQAPPVAPRLHFGSHSPPKDTFVDS